MAFKKIHITHLKGYFYLGVTNYIHQHTKINLNLLLGKLKPIHLNAMLLQLPPFNDLHGVSNG